MPGLMATIQGAQSCLSREQLEWRRASGKAHRGGDLILKDGKGCSTSKKEHSRPSSCALECVQRKAGRTDTFRRHGWSGWLEC